ncbi:hypothetical protein [Streptomyces sp. NPDC048663]|uniref:DUF6907 domain-containing protein n=1 Tax=Streptomyces sp. NPDC048663 TaxID=3155638 RepID=UPI003433AFA8
MHSIAQASTATPSPTVQRPTTVTVLLGVSFPGTPEPTEVWATPDMAPRHHFEATYDAEQTSREAAENTIRTVLAADGLDSVLFISAEPRTWMFLDSESGDPRSFTCMPGCVIRHDTVHEGRKWDPAEVKCWTRPNGSPRLPVESEDGFEDVAILSARIQTSPFAPSMSARLPHVVLDVVEDDYSIGGLDPDGLAVVIDTLAERLEALRRTRAELVRLRAPHVGRIAADGDTDTGSMTTRTPQDGAPVSRAWGAIEALFSESGNSEMTRKSLHEFVDMTADGAKAGTRA